MAKCARCRKEIDESDAFCRFSYRAGEPEYSYCQECMELFEEVRGEGVVVRERTGNRVEYQEDRWADSPEYNGRLPRTQVEALAAAVDRMEEEDARGLFDYQKSGSLWLISEYLETHPSIAEDVKKARGSGGGVGIREFLSNLVP